jgi:hypothetical protein
MSGPEGTSNNVLAVLAASKTEVWKREDIKGEWQKGSDNEYRVAVHLSLVHVALTPPVWLFSVLL